MPSNKCDNPKCTCQTAENVDENFKHRQTSDRRDFLKGMGLMGIGLALPPAITYWLQDKSSIQEIIKNPTIASGKAQHITILHTSDIHGQLDIHDEFFWENGHAVYKKRGGFATLRTMINELRNQNPMNTLVVDGGDCFQGSAVAALSQGQAIIPLVNKMNYDLVLPGNWEVVYGKKMMIHDMNSYAAAKVCANMFHKSNSEHESIFPPYQIFNVSGTRIGFIGYNDPLTPIRQSPAYSSGIQFTKPEYNIAKYIKILREEKKCALVFVISHMGLAQQLHLADQPSTLGVDYILGADTHERIREPLQGKYSKVTEPGAFASFIGKLDIVLENGKVKEENYALLDVDPEKYAEDRELKTMVAMAREPYKEALDVVIGKSKTPLVRYYIIETPMDNLITDALMWRFKTDIVVSNGFRFCPPLVPGKDGFAEITKEYLWSMLPVDSEVKMAEVTGAQIKTWLERELENVFAKDATKRFGGWLVRFKGMKINFTIAATMGSRVNEVLVNDQPLDPAKTYTMLACEREGDPDNVLCRMPDVHNPAPQHVLLHDVIEDYLSVFSPVAPQIEGRAIATDALPTLLTQSAPGLNYQFR